jgi:hypothetical protein
MSPDRPLLPTKSPRAVIAPALKPRECASAKAVGSFLPRLTRKAFAKYGFSAATLITDWAAIIGSHIGACTVPERLKWPREVNLGEFVVTGNKGRPGATLTVRVDAARALEVQYQGRQIIERINAYFGYRAVAELRLIQAPITKSCDLPSRRTQPRAAPPTPDVAAVSDQALRAALARLGAKIAMAKES